MANELDEETAAKELRELISYYAGEFDPEDRNIVLNAATLLETRAAALSPSWIAVGDLPKVNERTEMLFRTEWTGRDGIVRAFHEVFIVWPDGAVTDHGESAVAPDEFPTHFQPLPPAPR